MVWYGKYPPNNITFSGGERVESEGGKMLGTSGIVG